MTTLTDCLTETERQTFATLEAIIAANEQAAMAYVDSLTQIRTQRLYREKYQTWENYCLTKWGKSCRAITFSIDANKIRKQLVNDHPEFRKRASEITDRTALALKIVKPNQRKATLHRAQKLAGSKPVSPSHIARASRPEVNITNISSTGAYSSTPKPPAGPSAPASNHAHTPQPTLPPIQDLQNVRAHLEAAWEAHKLWFNELPNGNPRPPRDIYDKLISAISQPQ